MIRYYWYFVPAYLGLAFFFILIISKNPPVFVKVSTEKNRMDSDIAGAIIPDSAAQISQDAAIKNSPSDNLLEKVPDTKFVPFRMLHPRFALLKPSNANKTELSPAIDSDPAMKTESNANLPLCPEKSPFLVGFKEASTAVPNWEELRRTVGPTMEGGVYRARDCLARRKVAILVPYRDREEHLRSFLQHIHPFLQRQQTEYAIFVIEQKDSAPFNRGKLLNIGVTEALRQFPCDCFIFHDVDFLPENDHTVYGCLDQPLSFIGTAAKGTGFYRPYYRGYFGGVSSLNKQQMFMVNGFSNEYWGWGSEDDDLYRRLLRHNLTITRYPVEIAPYRMLNHVTAKGNNKRFLLLIRAKKRMEIDGLSNLEYRRLSFSKRALYTWIAVDLQFNATNANP